MKHGVSADTVRGYAHRCQSGYSLLELLVVVTFVGLTVLVAADSYRNRATRLEATVAARVLKTAIQRARMDAIFTGSSQFVVVDQTARRVEVFSDTGTTEGVFDDADERVFFENWSEGAQIALPPGQSSVSDPLGGSAVTTAWSLPSPDTSARWGTDLEGFTLTARGMIESAASTPVTINSATVIFSNQKSSVSAVVIRGRMGTVNGYELRNGSWEEL